MKFDSQVVLVTGSSRGLGAAFAMALGQEGATVVVNSTGRDDRGETVAAAIESSGGKAIHISDPVEAADALVAQVVERCGRLDAVVHNAGVVNDKSLAKMTDEQWHNVLNLHLKGAFDLTRAAWPHFVDQGGGRLVYISSASGLYGNFGQANYAAAKAGMYGLCRSVAIEGLKSNIRCNCVAPFGATTMNGKNMPDELKEVIKPAYIAPLISYLSHPQNQDTGALFEASAGVFRKLRWQRGQGVALDVGQPLSMAALAARWGEMDDFTNAEYPNDMRDSLQGLYESQIHQ